MMEIRGKSISFSAHKSKIRKNRENEIKHQIELLEANLTEQNKNQLKELEIELNAIKMEQFKGNMIRSKAFSIVNDEKPSKYFLNLEKK